MLSAIGLGGCTRHEPAPKPVPTGPSAAAMPAPAGSHTLHHASAQDAQPDPDNLTTALDAGMPAGSDASGMSSTGVPPDAACAPPSDAIAVEGSLGMGFRETPQNESDPEGMVDRTFTPDTKSMYPGLPPTTAFEGPTDRGTRGMVGFTLDASLVPEDLVGRKLHFRGRYKRGSCYRTGGSPRLPEEQGSDALSTLLDDSDKLLVLTAPATPTAAGGMVSFPAELVPDFGIRWLDDPSSCGQLALELTVLKTGEKVVAKAHQRRELELDGQTYVFVTEDVRAPLRGQVCGIAMWLVYRKGFFTPVP